MTSDWGNMVYNTCRWWWVVDVFIEILKVLNLIWMLKSRLRNSSELALEGSREYPCSNVFCWNRECKLTCTHSLKSLLEASPSELMVVSLTFLQNANMQVFPPACCCYHVWLVMLGVERNESDRMCRVDLTFRGSGMTEHFSQYKSLGNTEFRILELLCPRTWKSL